MKQKLITDELINEMLEAKGFGEKQINDDFVQEAVLNHFNVELTDNFTATQTSIYTKNQQLMVTQYM